MVIILDNLLRSAILYLGKVHRKENMQYKIVYTIQEAEEALNAGVDLVMINRCIETKNDEWGDATMWGFYVVTKNDDIAFTLLNSEKSLDMKKRSPFPEFPNISHVFLFKRTDSMRCSGTPHYEVLQIWDWDLRRIFPELVR